MSELESPASHLDRVIANLRETLVIVDAGDQPMIGALVSQTLDAAKAERTALRQCSVSTAN